MPQTLTVDVTTPPFTATALATPSSIARANGRAVNVHVALRSDTPGGLVRLDNSADLDGVVYAVPGVTYTLTYTVTEPLGSTAQARAKVVVGK